MRTAGSIDLLEQLGMRADIVRIGRAERDDVRTISPTDDAAAFARQFVAAARSAHALEDLGVDKALQAASRDGAAAAYGARRAPWRRPATARVKGDVDNGGDGEQAASRQEVHLISPRLSARWNRILCAPRSLVVSALACNQSDALDWTNDELRNARAPPNGQRALSKIDKYDADFAAVIRVDCPRAVEHRDPVFERQPRPRPDLRFVALWQFDRETRRDQRALARVQHNVLAFRHRRHEVHPGRIFTLITRQLQALGMRQSFETHVIMSRFAQHCGHEGDQARAATSCLLMRGQGFDARRRRRTEPCCPRRRTSTSPSATLLATIRSHLLRLSLSRAFSTNVSVSAAKPTTNVGRSGLRARTSRKNVGVLDEAQDRRAVVAFLDLLRATSLDPPVGDRGRRDEDIGRQRRDRPRRASRAPSRLERPRPRADRRARPAR